MAEYNWTFLGTMVVRDVLRGNHLKRGFREAPGKNFAQSFGPPGVISQVESFTRHEKISGASLPGD